MDPIWARRLERLGKANRRAETERMRALTPAEGLRLFERLTREIESTYKAVPTRRTHPVGLIKYIRERAS